MLRITVRIQKGQIMAAQENTIRQGISMAIRHPETGVELLARSFARHFQGAPWITPELKIRFCILFLSNLMDNAVEREIDPGLLRRVLRKSMWFGIRLLKRWPEEGLKMLVAVVMSELRQNQRYSESEMQQFYDEVIGVFFPEAVNLEPTARAQ
ncbi:MAG: hypothetical protein ACLFVE_12945 [Chitinispirillaceae bacterium]